MKRIALFDFDGFYWSAWHAGEQDEVTKAQTHTINRLRRLQDDFDHVVVCVDKGPYKRLEICSDYKANRPKKDQRSLELRRRTIELIRKDGFCVFEELGYEADDLIATVVSKLANPAKYDIVIHSNDKDLQALVNDNLNVSALLPSTGELRDSSGVMGRFGVAPAYLPMSLALAGDKIDNVRGVAGVGYKKAAEILQKVHFEWADLFVAAERDRLGDMFTPALAKNLMEAIESGALIKSLQLVELMTNAPIDVDAIFAERKPEPLVSNDEFDGEDMSNNDTVPAPQPTSEAKPDVIDAEPIPEPEPTQPSQRDARQPASQPRQQPQPKGAVMVEGSPPAQETAMVVHEGWGRELEPRSPQAAWQLAKAVVNSRLFSEYGNHQAVYLTIMAGREFGMSTMASLRGFHIVKGKPTMSALLMMGLCLQHPDCKTFRVRKSTHEVAVIEVERNSWDSSTTFSFDIEDAKKANLLGKDVWRSYTKNMLLHRCISNAAKFSFPETMHGMHTAEELGADYIEG
jgi:5'-3' exonuclease